MPEAGARVHCTGPGPEDIGPDMAWWCQIASTSMPDELRRDPPSSFGHGAAHMPRKRQQWKNGHSVRIEWQGRRQNDAQQGTNQVSFPV